MKNRIGRAYSTLFRFGGLALAAMSACVSVVLAIDLLRDGYVLVNGIPDRSVATILGAVAAPLAGVALGLCLFYFVPRVRRDE